ncbi:MAG TPA: hypothetical protein VF322_07635 [Gammaproteobacteria bacterium]
MTFRAPNDEPYRLLSIDSTQAPEGGDGDDWFSYRIAQGSNVITGYRQGKLAVIQASVEEIVAGLNERRRPKRGRVQLRRARPPKAETATAATASAAEAPAKEE